ncbi:MAG: class B sortase [Clostridiales bacterium]|nr:class B sortase [Clostridiales bacterium]
MRNKRIRSLILLVSLAAILVGGVGLIRKQSELRRQKALQESLEALVEVETTEAETETEICETEPEETEPQETEYVSPVDFDALIAENPDTVGWIRIADTNIDYPIVQAEDNSKYLHMDFSGADSAYGAIFLDCDSDSDLQGWNNPLYGHHMKNGTMFRDVVKFKEEDFFKEHRYFEIYTPERTICLKTVACYYTDSNGIVRRTQFESQEAFDEWVRDRLAPCRFADVPECSVDSMYVLVTCSYEENDARTLLFAVEADEDGEFVEATGRNERKNH